MSCLLDLLAQPNVVSILDLSSTDIPAELLFGALVRGCVSHLSHLNLARNPFLTKKSKGKSSQFPLVCWQHQNQLVYLDHFRPGIDIFYLFLLTSSF